MSISRRSSLFAIAGLGFAQTPSFPSGWKELKFGPAKQGGQNRVDGLSLRLENVALRTLVAHAHGLPWNGHRVDGPEVLSHELAITAVPGTTDPKAAAELLRALLIDRCKLSAHRETRKLPVKILRAARLKAPKQDNGQPELRVIPGSITGVGPIAALIPHVEFRVDSIVVDETGLGGNHRLDLLWESGNVDSFIDSLRDQLGLEVAAGTRDVEMLIVDRCEKPPELG